MLSTDSVGRQSSPGSVSKEEPCCWSVIPGTRLHQLLHSNEAPLESELADIETALSDLDARLALLDDEIARLKAWVEQLEEEHLAIGTRRQCNRAVLSPLRRIPPEVLAEVFLWSLPPIYGDYNLDVKQSPWVLTHVCSRWRTVALSTSSLWSRILITYSPGNDSSSAYPLPLVKAHIQRSGSQQLAVTFRGRETPYWEPQVEVLQCLTQHCGRWVELDMRLTSRLLPLLTSLRDQVPCLRKIYLDWESQPAIQSIDCFETARSLVDFSVDVPRYIPIHLPVPQLTRYSMNAPWDVHQRLLSLASNLTEARISSHIDNQSSSDSPIITLPFLRRLYVSDPEILDYITVPTLEEIALYVDRDDDGLDIPRRLASLLHRSSCPMRRLCLDGQPTACGTLAILQATSCIVELVILSMYGETPPLDDEATEVNTLMSTLTVSDVPGSAAVGLHLRCMIFGSDGRPFLDHAVFLEMIRSRCRAVPRHIERAALVICEGLLPDPETLNALYALRREGLDLSVLEGDAADDTMNRLRYME
ncbi:hypothetical protein GGX14DRAFT_692091 [Mycena pura]|uniref:F-box domain-containing protein n=1 Tax=Mycena pura TaxID=153505 RepID=A0AAD7E5R4_9AGAR|nr:hypothetical protein GGX14DRAFT_692091 [Mycena pura]